MRRISPITLTLLAAATVLAGADFVAEDPASTWTRGGALAGALQGATLATLHLQDRAPVTSVEAAFPGYIAAVSNSSLLTGLRLAENRSVSIEYETADLVGDMVHVTSAGAALVVGVQEAGGVQVPALQVVNVTTGALLAAHTGSDAGRWWDATVDAAEEHVIAVGYLANAGPDSDILVSKFRLADGGLLWTATLPTLTQDEGYDVVETDDGHLVLLSLEAGAFTFRQLDAETGAFRWLTVLPGAGRYYDYIDWHHNLVCAAGSVERDTDQRVGALTCVDGATGDLVHDHTHIMPDGHAVELLNLWFAADGDSVAAVAAGGGAHGVLRIHVPTGAVLWHVLQPAAEGADAVGYALSLDEEGRVYFGGERDGAFLLAYAHDPQLPAQVDLPPTVAAPLPSLMAFAGEEFSFVVPADTFADDVTPAAQLHVTGAVELVAGGAGLGGEVGIAVTAGAPGVATVGGTCTLVGDSTLRVTLTAHDAAGGNASLAFAIAVIDRPPFANATIPPQAAVAGRPFAFAVPAHAFADAVTPGADIQVTGAVALWQGTYRGGAVGLAVLPGAQGEVEVSGTPALAGDALLRVTLRGRDEAGRSAILAFPIAVTDEAPTVAQAVPAAAAVAGQPFHLLLPNNTFADALTPAAELAVTGTVAVAAGGAAGGAVGLAVLPGAQGEAAVAGTCTLVGDSVLAVTLRARDAGGKSVESSFHIAVTDEAPAVAASIPHQAALAGRAFHFPIPAHAFTDTVTPAGQLRLTGTVAVAAGGAAGGEVGLAFLPGVQGQAAVAGTCTLAGNSTLRVTVTATDAGGKAAQQEFDIVVTDEAPTVAQAVPAQAAVSGRPFSLLVPLRAFADALTPAEELTVTGAVAVAAGEGEAGVNVTAGAPGLARVHGTPLFVGDAVLRVTLTATDAGGNAAQQEFDIAVTDRAPVLAQPISAQVAIAGEEFSFVVPADTFADDVTPAAQLHVTGAVELVAGGARGGAVGLAVAAGAPGQARVHGTPTLVGSGVVRVTLTATDAAQRTAVTSFAIVVTDEAPVVQSSISDATIASGRPYELLVPADTFHDALTATADLRVSGGVSRVEGGTLGGRVGLVVTYGAPGQVRVHGTPTLVGDAVLQVTLVAADEAGRGAMESFLLTVVDEPPTVVQEAGDVAVEAGEPFSYTVPAAAFADVVTPPHLLHVTGAVAVVSGGTQGGAVGLAVAAGAPGQARVHGTPTLIGGALLRVTLTVTDGAGKTASDSFDVTVTDSPPYVAEPIANRTVRAGRAFALTVPSGTFADTLTATADLVVEGEVAVVANTSLVLEQDVQVLPGAPGVAVVAGTAELPAGTKLRVTLTARDEAGQTTATTFDIDVVAEPAPRSRSAVAPALVGGFALLAVAAVVVWHKRNPVVAA